MTVSIRDRQQRQDPIARSHRRATVARVMFGVAGICAILGVLGWFFLFSSFFAVTDITVSGSATIGDEPIRASVRELLDRRTLQLFQPARNIVLLDPVAVSQYLQEKYRNTEGVTVRKRYPHLLDISVTERVPFGLWCRDEQCQYFDRSGARWGSALPSRGPLLVRVQDERTDGDMSQQLVRGILAIIDGLPELGLRGYSVELPDSAPGDARITVNKRYGLLMDTFGDITDQLSTLGVLLADRAKDPSWVPQYIDVRTPGRAYYK